MASASDFSQIIDTLQKLGIGSIPDHLPEPADKTRQTLIQAVNKVIDFIAQQDKQIHTMIQLDHYRLASLIDSLTPGVALYNQKLELIIANLSLRRIFNLPGNQPITVTELIGLLQLSDNSTSGMIAETGKGIWEKIPFSHAVSKIIQYGKPIRYPEVPFRGQFFEISFIPIMDRQAVTGGAIIFHDITHLVEVDRMKTEFVSVASHQLRTPLTSMRLFLEMLLDNQIGEINDQQKEYLANIQESTLRMIRLVNEFLNVSRIESGRLKIEPQITNLVGFIEDVVSDLQILAREHHCKLTFHQPGQIINQIPIDQPLMREILRNLITNALYYTPADHGHIEINLQLISKPSPQPPSSEQSITTKFPGSFIMISVKDNGIGIPQAAQSKIFQKFFRADNAVKNRSEGSGLGLYLVKMIMDSVRGKVWFESREGQGTTFFLALPTFGMLSKEGEKNLAG